MRANQCRLRVLDINPGPRSSFFFLFLGGWALFPDHLSKDGTVSPRIKNSKLVNDKTQKKPKVPSESDPPRSRGLLWIQQRKLKRRVTVGEGPRGQGVSPIRLARRYVCFAAPPVILESGSGERRKKPRKKASPIKRTGVFFKRKGGRVWSLFREGGGGKFLE